MTYTCLRHKQKAYCVCVCVSCCFNARTFTVTLVNMRECPVLVARLRRRSSGVDLGERGAEGVAEAETAGSCAKFTTVHPHTHTHIHPHTQSHTHTLTHSQRKTLSMSILLAAECFWPPRAR